MASIKDKALKDNASEDVQVHELTDPEIAYLRLLNMSLQYHTLARNIITGYMYYVAITRLGYKDGVNLQFEIDLNADDKKLTVKLLPDNATEALA